MQSAISGEKPSRPILAVAEQFVAYDVVDGSRKWNQLPCNACCAIFIVHANTANTRFFQQWQINVY
jgi:hypothetical protein